MLSQNIHDTYRTCIMSNENRIRLLCEKVFLFVSAERSYGLYVHTRLNVSSCVKGRGEELNTLEAITR